jgi:predicted transcriptional regulator
MEVLWAAPGQELTGRAVADELPSHAYTTVSTVLDRLSHKGLVRRRLEDRTRRYAAIGTQAEHTATLMHEALGTIADPEGALTAFLASMTAPQRATLRRALGTKPTSA